MLYLVGGAIILFFVWLLGTKKGRSFAAKTFRKMASSSLKIALYIATIGGLIALAGYIIYLAVTNIGITLFIAAIIIVAFYFYSKALDKKHREEHARVLAEWQTIEPKSMTDNEIYNILSAYTKNLYDSDSNTVKFKENIPFGRVNYFLNFFERDLSEEEPLYFSPVRSQDRDELREYGLVVTTAGIYVSQQLGKKNKDGTSRVRNVYMPFAGMISRGKSSNNVSVDYVVYDDSKYLEQSNMTVSVDAINAICDAAMQSGISKAVYSETVYNATFIADEQENRFRASNESTQEAAGIAAAGVAETLAHDNVVFNDVGYSMGKRQAHGGAAEYANTVLDKAGGDFRAKQIGGDNAKDGADRVTYKNGMETLIQCKYCRDANTTINDAFKNHDYPKDMKVEVPKDQYSECVNKLQKMIDNGELESKGIAKGEKAENYLMKGKITYAQSANIALSGSVEGLAIDALQGVMCSAGAAGITALLTFATCKWNGMENKDAALQSLHAGALVMGKGTAVYVITMQLSARSEIKNYLAKLGINKGSNFTNPFYKIGNGLAKKINSSSLAKSGIRKTLGLDKIKGQAIIGGAVTVVITFGPDIVRALSGRISSKQLIKNSAVGGAGIAGAAIGQTLIPVPVVGSMIGGAVAGFIAKKTLDHFIEDDAIEMFQILKEEFIEAISFAGLTSEEFDKVVSITLAHKKLPSILRDMYAYGDSRQYAKEQIMGLAIQSVYSEREKITDEMYENGYLSLLEEN